MFYYLATPYTKYKSGIEKAYEDACAQASRFTRLGIPVFSPIAHTHGLAIHGKLDPCDVALWMAVDRPFMESATLGLIVCMLDGWDASHGVSLEIDFFKEKRRPVFYVLPDGPFNHVMEAYLARQNREQYGSPYATAGRCKVSYDIRI